MDEGRSISNYSDDSFEIIGSVADSSQLESYVEHLQEQCAAVEGSVEHCAAAHGSRKQSHAQMDASVITQRDKIIV